MDVANPIVVTKQTAQTCLLLSWLPQRYCTPKADLTIRSQWRHSDRRDAADFADLPSGL